MWGSILGGSLLGAGAGYLAGGKKSKGALLGGLVGGALGGYGNSAGWWGDTGAAQSTLGKSQLGNNANYSTQQGLLGGGLQQASWAERNAGGLKGIGTLVGGLGQAYGSIEGAKTAREDLDLKRKSVLFDIARQKAADDRMKQTNAAAMQGFKSSGLSNYYTV